MNSISASTSDFASESASDIASDSATGQPLKADERNYNLRLRHPDAMEVMRQWQQRSLRTRQQFRVIEDLAYGEDPLERLDLFPATQAHAPLLVFIHGGYWQGGDKRDVSLVTQPFVQAGMSVALLNYGLAPTTPMETMVAQTAHALRWLARHADQHGVSAQRMHLMGHSAGGHLASMMLTHGPATSDVAGLVCSVTAISGLFDLAPLINTSWNQALGLDAARASQLSPIHRERASDAPLFTLVGGEETEGFKQQAAHIERHWRHVQSLGLVTGKHHYNVLDIFDTSDDHSPSSLLARLLAITSAP